MTHAERDDLSKKLRAWTVVVASDPGFQRAVWRRIAARQAGSEAREAGLDRAGLGQLPAES